MKITCDNCGAKYSIADEKVRGKVFKIRCKKCSHIVVVRGVGGGGDEVAAEPASASASQAMEHEASPAGAVWHVVVGREQVGPCTASDVRERFAAGEVNSESYIWREGFVDWQRLATVDEFSDLGPSSRQAAADYPPEEAELPSAALAGSEADMGSASSDFAAGMSGVEAAPSLAAAGGSLFGGGGEVADAASQAGSNGQSGLFGGGAAGGRGRMFGDEDDDEGGDLAHPQMTGQRGENSVLFSLANLQALAMGEGSSAAPVAVSGMAKADKSSGLIDIRAMAAASSRSAPAGADDDLPIMAGFAGPVAAAPVLLPSSGSDRPAWLIPTIAGIGVALVAMIVLLVVLLTREPQSPSQAAPVPMSNAIASSTDRASVGAAVRQAPLTRDKAADDSAEADEADTKPSGQAAAGDGDEGDEKEADEGDDGSQMSEKAAPRRRARRQAARRRSTSPAAPAAVAQRAEPAQKPRRREGPRDELDRLLDSSMGARRAPRASTGSGDRGASAADSNLPSQLSRTQIVAGMQAVKGRVQSCYDRYKVPGLADVRLKIGNDGHVKSALVKGLFTGTPTGACVQSAVMSARFSRFKSSVMSITYPFMLR